MKKNDASCKALRIIGSILVAIALWIYVDTVTSPEVTLKVKNVPVEFSGEDTTLADRGLMLLSGYDTTVDLVINTPTRGRKQDSDGFKIRRAAVEHSVACVTAIDTARALLTVRELGRSEDGCWMLTLYGRWHGWVSMDHLEKITQ